MYQLTFRLFLFTVNVLANQNFIEPIVSHFQHKPPVYHTVAGFQSPVDDVTMVQVLHTLKQNVECL